MLTTRSLEQLLDSGQLWQGRTAAGHGDSHQPTGIAALDRALPGGGWPAQALTEILTPGPGFGEMHLLWPTLARLTQAASRVVLIAPPYLPLPLAWQGAGVDLRWLHLIKLRRYSQPVAEQQQQALWAAEQCLRSGSCAAVLCWPQTNDPKILRRLQVAATSGHCLGFAYRPLTAAKSPSPAALRLAVEHPGQVRILKCRGGLPPARPVSLA